jgi:hypothetical protein
MSELSQSPPLEEPELEIEETHVEADDDGISTDTSGSLPGSPGADDDNEIPPTTICKWDECMQNMRTLDALVRHVHDCISLQVSCWDAGLLQSILVQGGRDILVNGTIVHVEE